MIKLYGLKTIEGNITTGYHEFTPQIMLDVIKKEYDEAYIINNDEFFVYNAEKNIDCKLENDNSTDELENIYNHVMSQYKGYTEWDEYEGWHDGNGNYYDYNG